MNAHTSLDSCGRAENKEVLSNRWYKVQELLKDELGSAVFDDWIKDLFFIREDEDDLVLGAPNPFIKDWVMTHYRDVIISFLRKETSWCSFFIEIDPLIKNQESLPGQFFEKIPAFRVGSRENFSEISFESSPLDPRFTFEKFVVGKPNEFAYAAAQRIAESEDVAYNPLFLYGPVGHGKTHLMHAIAHHIATKYGGRKTIFYLSAEKFMYYFIKALRYKDTVTFKERFRSVDVLMIDDVQFISGKDSTQEEFFHTFNALVDKKRQVIISADKSPSDLELQERMKSRLGWGLVADLHPTTYELRLGILQTKVLEHTVEVPKEVLEFLAQKISSSVRELEGALTRVVAHATFIGRTLDVVMAQEVLRDLLRSHQKEITMDEIQKQVAQYYSIRITDMHSAKRARHIVRPRQIAMFLTKHLTTISLPNIGKHFGGRDHTTVIHAVQTILNLSERDETLREDLLFLRKTLENV